ncbi:MAG TPA: GlsB/YeaQ/YmgE family stress response membrane protein [Actinomycetota bacterium]|nr:GlsB/YeaQ/YmgE family stress response membrane protein [Actinomycetota bacterium]
MDILAWIVLGLVAGAVARLLMPGRDSMGILGTILLGIIGSIVGGFIVSMLVDGDGFQPVGLIGSVLGAMLALFIWRSMSRGRGAGSSGYRRAA